MFILLWFWEVTYLNGINYWLRDVILKDSEWDIAISAILTKCRDIIRNVRVLSYFFVSIVFLGAAGIWLPWINHATSNVHYFRGDNIFTFVVALLGGLLCNKIFHADRVIKTIFNELATILANQPEHKSRDLWKIFTNRKIEYKEQIILSAIGLFWGAISLICIIYAYSNSTQQTSLVGAIGLIMALILYLFSTAEDINESSKFPVLTDEDIPEETVFTGKKVEPNIMFTDAPNETN
jgi:hypothetical protein